MRHLLIFLLLATPVFCWPKITTNFLGIPLDVVTMSAPGANYVPTYNATTKQWEAAAGGGGTVTAVNGGTGISTGISGTTVTVTNTGVTSAVAGTGVSVSGATGAVTFGNTGVTSAVAGTGISVSGGTGAVTIGNTGVISVTAGTNVTLGGTAANPIINSTGGTTSNTTPTGFPETSTVQKFLVPLYIYPTLAGWTNYYATSPKTGIVVANPSSGPGGSPNSDYTAGILGMHTNGIQVIGYVHTRVSPGGAFRPLLTVEGEVDSWYSFYPTIDGIFFDEVDSVGGSTEVTYFTALWNYVRTKSTRNLVVLNPGTNTAEVYAGISDIIVTSENSYATYSGSYVVDAWTRKYPATHFCHIVHTCTPTNLAAAVNLTKKNRAGYTYITDDPATYTVNPTYLTEAITSIGLVDGRFPMIYSGINGTTNVSPTSVLHINGGGGIAVTHTQVGTTEDVTATPTTATAVSVGATNGAGSGTSLALANHTHAVTDLAIASQTTSDLLKFNGANWVRVALGGNSTVLQVSSGGVLQYGTVTSAMITDGTITDTDVAAANKDGAAGTASMRTLGTGSAQALPGNTATGFSTTTGPFVIPAQGATVSVTVSAGASFNTNSGVQISDGTRTMNGHVTAGGTTTTLTVQNDGLPAGAVGNNMSSGANVVSALHPTTGTQGNQAIFRSDGTIGAWATSTGTGAPVQGTSPTITTPTLNGATVASSTVLTVTQETTIPPGIVVGLNANVAAASDTINVSWSNVSVSDGTQGCMLGSFSGSASCATAGSAINGRDQAGTFANNVWVFVYAISKADGTIPALLLSQSATAPTYPTNYTKKSNPLFAFFTGGGTNSVRAFQWLDGRCYYVTPFTMVTTSNVTAFTDLNTGSSSTGLVAAVPPQANSVGITSSMAGTVIANSGIAQWSLDGTATFVTFNALEVSGVGNITGLQNMPLSGQHGYFKVTSSSDTITISACSWGWSTN